MHAEKSNATPRRPRRAGWGLPRWSTRLLLGLCCVALSGCAGWLKAPPAPTTPRIGLSDAQRSGALCEGIRGRLPPAEELAVGEGLSLWVEAEARAACWREGYLALVGIADRADKEWEAYANARRR